MHDYTCMCTCVETKGQDVWWRDKPQKQDPPRETHASLSMEPLIHERPRWMEGVCERARASECVGVSVCLSVWGEEIYENKSTRCRVWSKLQTFMFAWVATSERVWFFHDLQTQDACFPPVKNIQLSFFSLTPSFNFHPFISCHSSHSSGQHTRFLRHSFAMANITVKPVETACCVVFQCDKLDLNLKSANSCQNANWNIRYDYVINLVLSNKNIKSFMFL